MLKSLITGMDSRVDSLISDLSQVSNPATTDFNIRL